MLTMKKRKQEVDKDINNACPQILIPKDTSYVASTLNPLPLRIISKHSPVPHPPQWPTSGYHMHPQLLPYSLIHTLHRLTLT